MAKAINTLLDDDGANLETLKVLAENSFDAVLMTDATAKGAITYANSAFKKLTGYTQAEVVGKTPRILQGPATDKAVIDRLRTALATGKRFEGKAINYKKDKTPFIMHWRVLPVRRGGLLDSDTPPHCCRPTIRWQQC